jgi:hypothetical protein
MSIAKLEALHAALGYESLRWWPGYGVTPRLGSTITIDASDDTPLDEFDEPKDYEDCVVDMPCEDHPVARFLIAAHNAMPAVLRALRAAQAITDYGERPFNKADAPIPGPLALLMVKLNIALASLSAPSQEAQR